jgi:DNA-binding IscR family transcriptional regulator
MYELGAVTERLRKTRQAVASRVQRGLSASSIGTEFSALNDAGFIRSREGNKGGCWLTAKGIARAKENLSPATIKNP